MSLSASLLTAQAQLFSPEAFHGALFGSLIGGVVGGDCHHGFSGDGAAIGAGVGLLAGAIAGESRRNYYYDAPGYVYSTAPAVSIGYGYGHYGNSAYVYYAPNSYCAPGYYYRSTARPNYAISGTVLGAASGALIGQGAKGNPGGGAAIGAAAGLVLGGVAEHTARKQEQRVVAVSTTASQPQQPAPAPVTQDSRLRTPDSSVTSQSGPTSTYYWTPRPQIADAPRVPDAPTF